MNARNITTFAILLVTASGSWYLASSLKSPEIVETATDGSGDGYYLKSARILGTDDQPLLVLLDSGPGRGHDDRVLHDPIDGHDLPWCEQNRIGGSRASP